MVSHLTDEQYQEIQTAISEGKKIDAIRIYRQSTGADLAEAKEAVEDMQARQPAGSSVSPEVQLEQIKLALFEGRKLEAIKIYRKGTGAGLAEATAEIDRLEAGLWESEPQRFTSERAGCLGATLWMVVLTAGGVTLTWYGCLA